MDQISRIRFRNLVDNLLSFCDNAGTDEDKAVLLRIGIVTLNKLRIHGNVDPGTGYEIRKLTERAAASGSEEVFVFSWDETIELLEACREEFV